jgi:hypothetical protein
LIVTSEEVGAHPPNPDVMVHLKTEVNPIVSPVTPDVGLFTEVADPEPETVVHVPVSLTLVELAARVVAVIPQRFCVGPAAAIVVVESEVIVTSEKVGAQPENPDVIVHRRTVVPPIVSPVTAEVSLLTDDADPVPDCVVHVPVSEPAAALAASVPEVVLQRFCTGPAAATVIAGSTLIVTSEIVGAHPPKKEVIVHLSTVVPPIVRPVTTEVSLLIEEADPVPEIVDHVPVSAPTAALAANVVLVVLQRFCTGPAAAMVVVGSTFIVTSLKVGAHPPNPDVIVHLSTVVPPMVSPTTAEVSLFIDNADPLPETVDQVPVSEPATALAASVPEVVLQRF